MGLTIDKYCITGNISKERGFSIIELLVVMTIFAIIMAVSASVFTNILGESKRQAKIGEAQLESTVGLETLRSDIEHAGYGLPQSFQNANQMIYAEANVIPGADPANSLNDSPSGVPRAILGDPIAVNIAGSAYLAIKAANVAMNAQSQTWTQVGPLGVIFGLPAGQGSDRPQIGEGVIVLDPQSGSNYRRLIMNGNNFSVSYTEALSAAYSPTAQISQNQTYTVYGIDNAAPLRMPFNRADYFISLAGVPSNCAIGTGVLTKNTVNHAGGALNAIPLIDCVADFQVFFGLDTNNDGVIEFYTPDIVTANPLSPQQIREQVKEVRVYLLLHEGRRDPSFTFNNFTGGGTSVRVGEASFNSRNFNLAPIANYQNYRWKLVTLVVTPKNLK